MRCGKGTSGKQGLPVLAVCLRELFVISMRSHLSSAFSLALCSPAHTQMLTNHHLSTCTPSRPLNSNPRFVTQIPAHRLLPQAWLASDLRCVPCEGGLLTALRCPLQGWESARVWSSCDNAFALLYSHLFSWCGFSCRSRGTQWGTRTPHKLSVWVLWPACLLAGVGAG